MYAWRVIMSMEKFLYNKREAAVLLSVCPRTIDNLVRAGELKPRRVGRRCLFSAESLRAFARRDHVTQPAGANGEVQASELEA